MSINSNLLQFAQSRVCIGSIPSYVMTAQTCLCSFYLIFLVCATALKVIRKSSLESA